MNFRCSFFIVNLWLNIIIKGNNIENMIEYNVIWRSNNFENNSNLRIRFGELSQKTTFGYGIR